MTIKEDNPESDEKKDLEIAHKVEMTFHLDKEKIEQIHKCLQNGKLTLTVHKANLLESGRFSSGYLYD